MDIEEASSCRPVVSIGMPVFNGEAYLAEAVQSLLGQSFQNLELIISDNGSTDGTAEICERVAAADARVRYYRQATNIGSLANFEFVFRQAKGKYFMWAAHDDIWSPTWVEELVRRIGPASDVCAFGRVLHVDECGAPVRHIANDRPFRFSSPYSLVRRVGFFLQPEALGKANTVYGVFPCEAIQTYLPVFLRGYRYGDCAMLWCLLSEYRLVDAGNVFLYKRLHAGAASGGKPAGVALPGWQSYARGLFFMAGTNLSFRGIGDYLHADAGPVTVLCLLLAPMKMLSSFFKMRAAVRLVAP